MVARTFYRWIVLIDEMRLYELDCEGRLSDTAASDDNELVLAQKVGFRHFRRSPQ